MKLAVYCALAVQLLQSIHTQDPNFRQALQQLQTGTATAATATYPGLPSQSSSNMPWQHEHNPWAASNLQAGVSLYWTVRVCPVSSRARHCAILTILCWLNHLEQNVKPETARVRTAGPVGL